MRKSLILFAAVTLIGAGAAGAAGAQTIDKNGKCHAADGKMAKMEVCKAVKPAAAAQCRDASGKFAKCGSPGATPAVAATPASKTTMAAATPAKPATPAVPPKPAAKATSAPAKK